MSKKRKRYSVRAVRSNHSRRTHQKIKLFLFAVFSVFASTIVLISVSIYKFVNAPFTSAAHTPHSSENVWKEGRTNLVMLVVDDRNYKYSEILDMSLISFDVDANHYTIYHFPVDFDVEYARNYGSGSLKKTIAVGNVDQDRGVYLLEQTLLKYLAIGIDGYIITDPAGLSELGILMGEINQEDLSASLRLRNLPKLPSAIKNFRNISITNLKLSDIIDMTMFIHGTSDTSSKVVDVNRYQFLEGDNWDTLWQSDLLAPEIKEEGIKVFVANASDPRMPGLAGWGARVVKNLGGDVLDAKNSFTDFNENTLIVESPELLTARTLQETLGITNVLTLNELDERYGYNPQIFRSKVSLVLVSF